MLFKKQKCKIQNAKCKTEVRTRFCPLRFALCVNSGFTLVELIVVIGIFVFMTALVVEKYGSFNDGTLLTSMTYDVALALRDAQSYGLNVQGTNEVSQSFNYPYGMDFNDSTLSNQSQMILFADSSPAANGVYGDGLCLGGSNKPCATDSTSGGDNIITIYTLARGGLIKCLNVLNTVPSSPNPCNPTNNVNAIDITFKRPDPNAIIKAVNIKGIVSPNGDSQTWPYAIIQVEDASKTSTRSIIVNETGEIAVQNQ